MQNLLNDVVCKRGQKINLEQTSRTKYTEKPSSSDNNDVISSQASKVSKEHKPACKLQNLGTRISADTLERFRKFVLYRHGKMNGPFSQEIGNAIEFYMNNQQQTTSYTSLSKNFGHPRSDVIEKYRRIAKEFKHLKTYPLLNIPTIKNVVKTILGESDPRTFNKHLKYVVKLSKPEDGNHFGVMPFFNVTRFVTKIQRDDW